MKNLLVCTVGLRRDVVTFEPLDLLTHQNTKHNSTKVATWEHLSKLLKYWEQKEIVQK